MNKENITIESIELEEKYQKGLKLKRTLRNMLIENEKQY
jgi:hypothetical protein